MNKIAVKNFLKNDLPVIKISASIKDAAFLLLEDKVAKLFVIDEEEKLNGEITKEKIISYFLGRNDPLKPVREILIRSKKVLSLYDEITKKELSGLPYAVPVVDTENHFCGAVYPNEILLELSGAELNDSTFPDIKREIDVIFNSSYDAIFVTDRYGNVLKANPAFERITGYILEKFLKKNLKDLIRQKYINDSSTLEALKTGKTCSKTHITKQGRVLVETSTPIFDKHNSLVKVVANLRDITELNELKTRLDEALTLSKGYLKELEQFRAKSFSTGKIIFRSLEMQKIIDLAAKVANFNATVIISGESGVGKELIARFIHEIGPRKKGPFIEVNCGAIPDTLIESELFGYETGAFTGAKKDGKQGLFELANHGTIFLDEIADLPVRCQPKLLRVLQDSRISKIGGRGNIKVDVRVVAATNRDIEGMVKDGSFREDLYYRLRVIPIYIKPLRERKDDIPPLLQYYLSGYAKVYNLERSFDTIVMDKLCSYHWPGNVRQLKNLVERLVVTSSSSKITVNDLPEDIQEELELTIPAVLNKARTLEKSGKTVLEKEPVMIKPLAKVSSLQENIENLEKEVIAEALEKWGSTYKAAKALNINQSTVFRKAKKYKLI